VGSRLLGRSRWFRYEVRAWPDGVLPDEQHAVGGPRLLATDPARARRLLDAVPEVPTPVWGRDELGLGELGLGEMWNSNSVVLLERQCGRLLDGVRRHRAAGSLR
jgi:hypothetical protein